MNTRERIQLVQESTYYYKNMKTFCETKNIGMPGLLAILSIYQGLDSLKLLSEVTCTNIQNICNIYSSNKQYIKKVGKKYKLTPAGIELCEKYIATLQPD